MAITDATNGRIAQTDVHDILRNGRRLKTLQHLQQEVEPLSLRELSERIAEMESGTSPAPRNLRESVYNSLHQTHLPKLDDHGVIEYDKERKTIELKHEANQVSLYMEVVTAYGLSWAGIYRTLGVLSLCLVVFSESEIPMFEAIPTVAVATVFLIVFVLATSYQLWNRRWVYLRSLVT